MKKRDFKKLALLGLTGGAMLSAQTVVAASTYYPSAGGSACGGYTSGNSWGYAAQQGCGAQNPQAIGYGNPGMNPGYSNTPGTYYYGPQDGRFDQSNRSYYYSQPGAPVNAPQGTYQGTYQTGYEGTTTAPQGTYTQPNAPVRNPQGAYRYDTSTTSNRPYGSQANVDRRYKAVPEEGMDEGSLDNDENNNKNDDNDSSYNTNPKPYNYNTKRSG